VTANVYCSERTQLETMSTEKLRNAKKPEKGLTSHLHNTFKQRSYLYSEKADHTCSFYLNEFKKYFRNTNILNILVHD